jgi:hypothetical protein
MVHSCRFPDPGPSKEVSAEYYMRTVQKEPFPEHFLMQLQDLKNFGPNGWCSCHTVSHFSPNSRVYWEVIPLYTQHTGDFLIGVREAKGPRTWGLWHNNYGNKSYGFIEHYDDHNFGGGGPTVSATWGPALVFGSTVSVMLDARRGDLFFARDGNMMGGIQLDANKEWLPFIGGYGGATAMAVNSQEWRFGDLAESWMGDKFQPTAELKAGGIDPSNSEDDE